MNRMTLTLAALGAAGALAACGQKQEAATATPPPAAEPAAPAASADAGMAGMNMSAEPTMAKGAGTVTAVTTDSVTIDHQPIPEAGWPAMTMGFKASPQLAKSVKPGDKVTFDLQLKDGGGEITAITKQ
jgi:Cu(I)/Ag(I) efflux system protein CusF